MNRTTKAQLESMAAVVNSHFKRSEVHVAGRYGYTALDLGWKDKYTLQKTIATCLTKREAYDILSGMADMADILEKEKQEVKP